MIRKKATKNGGVKVDEDIFRCLVEDFEEKLNRSLSSKELEYLCWVAKQIVKEDKHR